MFNNDSVEFDYGFFCELDKIETIHFTQPSKKNKQDIPLTAIINREYYDSYDNFYDVDIIKSYRTKPVKITSNILHFLVLMSIILLIYQLYNIE
jgi:hypothetical protein